MPRRHSPPLGATLAKAASGALELMPIALVQGGFAGLVLHALRRQLVPDVAETRAAVDMDVAGIPVTAATDAVGIMVADGTIVATRAAVGAEVVP